MSKIKDIFFEVPTSALDLGQWTFYLMMDLTFNGKNIEIIIQWKGNNLAILWNKKVKDLND